MTNSTEQAASKLRTGFAKGALEGIRSLGSLAADKIQTHHVPPLQTDGIWDGKTWAKAMEDLYNGTILEAVKGFRQTVEVRVTRDDEIQMRTHFTGTLKDGTALDHIVDGLMTMKDGRIVRGITIYNAERDSWAGLLKAMSPPAA